MSRRAAPLGLAAAGAAIAAASLFAFAGIAGAAFPGSNGRIVFADVATDPSHIYAVNPDGSGLDRLTSKAFTGFPSWSPDSKHIVYTRFGNAGGRILIMNADGTHKRLLKGESRRFDDRTPKYTPDGRQIVYTRCRSDFEGCAIWKMKTDGRHRHALTPSVSPDNETFDTNPTVSPDGHQIAFGREGADGYVSRVFVMDADGGDPHPITDAALEAGTPDWSPDGERIVFNSFDLSASGSSVYTVRPDGSDLDRMTPDRYPLSDFTAANAPEGDQLVFTSGQNYADGCCFDLFTVDADGGGEDLLDVGFDGHFPVFPSWGSAPLSP
jgi:TolB protein